jgi:hypothetical protein
MTAGGDALAPSPSSLLWQLNKRTGFASDLLQVAVEVRQHLFREAGANSTTEKEPSRTIVTDKQSTKVLAAAFGWTVAADHELLGLG